MKGILPNVKLVEYQLLGLNWMALLNRTKFGGGKTPKIVRGILADEMGLGKVRNGVVRDFRVYMRVLVSFHRSPLSTTILVTPDRPNNRILGMAQPSEQGRWRPRAFDVVYRVTTTSPNRRPRVRPFQLDERIQEIRAGHDHLQISRQSSGVRADS